MVISKIRYSMNNPIFQCGDIHLTNIR